MNEYIPYSKRNNITDPDLAGLLDYLEREIGWDIQFRDIFEASKCIEDKNDPKNEIIDSTLLYWRKMHESWQVMYGGHVIADIDDKVFMRTYKAILPVIRDLYSK